MKRGLLLIWGRYLSRATHSRVYGSYAALGVGPTSGEHVSMTPANRLDVPVEALVEGVWHPGFLEHRRRRGDTWEGFVRLTEAPGETRIGWFGYDELRTVDE